jgi:hypothetical protein
VTRDDWANAARIALRKRREWNARAGAPGADVADCVEMAQSARHRATVYVRSGAKQEKDKHYDETRSASVG